MLYESPIHVYTTEISQKIAEECDRTVFEETKKVGVYVEKDELIKALEYDRDQYQKGFRDGRLSIEQKTGMWFTDGNGTLRCSECKEEALLTLDAIEDVPFTTFSESRFCPNCGAKMEG